MQTPYQYHNEWGDIPALHAVCSYFTSHRDRTTAAPMEIGYFLATFAEANRANVIHAREVAAQLRAATARGDAPAVERLTAAKRESKTAAPYIIPAAYYPGHHTANALCEYTGVLCVDIDRQDNPAPTREEWANLPRDLMASSMGKYVTLVGESRSGWEFGGYFALIPVQHISKWREVYASIAKWFTANGVRIDEAAKNLNHGRALTWQDNATRAGYDALPLVNPQAQPYPYTYEPPKPPKRAYHGGRGDDFAKVRRAADYISSHNIPMCEDYDTWTRCAFALASTFGEAGEDLFLQIASTAANYREGENRRKYRNACRTARGSITISTFYKLCQENKVPLN